MPLRELYWNIAGYWLIYPLFLPFALSCFYGCYRLMQLVRVGRPDAGTVRVTTRVRALVDQVALQHRLLGQPLAGSLHAAISWGFGNLLVATCLVAAQDYLGLPTLKGVFYSISCRSRWMCPGWRRPWPSPRRWSGGISRDRRASGNRATARRTASFSGYSSPS